MLGGMDAMHWVLVVLLVAAVGAAGWLLVQRGVLMARAAEADRGKVEAEARVSEAHSRMAAMVAERVATEDTVRDLTAEVAKYAVMVEAAGRAHAAAVESMQREHAAMMDSNRRAHVKEIEHERTMLGEREAAVLRREADLRGMIEESKRNEAERQAQLKATFAVLAGEVAKQNSSEFLKLASERLGTLSQASAADLAKRQAAVEEMVKPIAESLKRADEKLTAFEQQRASGDASIKSQIEILSKTNVELRSETGKLVKSLREPQVRGRYGEIQLRRVAELAGMKSYCDFTEQDHTTGDDGKAKRPDMVVRLPNGRELIVDAKANLKPYLDAMEATEPAEIDRCLQRFADGVAEQAVKLAKKGYYAEYAGSAEFVVMFMPGDQFVDAALAKRGDLLDFAAADNVILASPSSLIAMLRAVAVGFGEARLAAHAQELLELGKTLHKRCATVLEHAAKVGSSLDSAVKSYNEFVGSAERNMLPTLRRFEQAEVKSTKEIPELGQVETKSRSIAGLMPGAAEITTKNDGSRLFEGGVREG